MIRRSAFAVIALVALIAPWAAPPATSAAEDDPFEVFANELDVPRGMEFGPDGSLYIAEGGEGGDDCNDAETTCWGKTGAITRVKKAGSQSRVLTGLPSASVQTPEGEGIVGPTDVSVHGGIGYFQVATDGGIFTHGDAPFFGSTGAMTLNQPIVDIVVTPSGLGYWLFAADGGVFTFGDAQFYGSMGGKPLNKPIVAAFATASGKGYILIALDGGVFTFGDAQFHGSTGGKTLNQPIVAVIRTASGKGYYLIAADGGVFTFGDAVFKGSQGGSPLNKPIVDAILSPTGDGYLLAATDGGIFTHGDAVFRGSTGDKKLNQPIVAIIPTPTGLGYWLIAADGGVFTFGDAVFLGSMGGTKLNKPVVSGAVTPVSMAFTIGLGGDPDSRKDLGPFGNLFATAGVATGDNGWRVLSDMGAFEKTNNPDKKAAADGGIDTNPFAILMQKGFAFGVDAGGNDILRMNGGTTTALVMPPVAIGDSTTDAVPTSLVEGPDGAFYIGQLTGFPFAENSSTVWRWVPGPGTSLAALVDDLSTVVDIAFGPDGTLYVSELRLHMEGPPNGRVLEIKNPGKANEVRRTLMSGLFFPTGLAAGKDGRVYVVNCGLCTDTGMVLAFDPKTVPEGGIVAPSPIP